MNITTGRIDGSRKVHVGMDVHKESIAVAVAWTDGETGEIAVRDLGEVPNRPGRVERWIVDLARSVDHALKFTFEAGSCGPEGPVPALRRHDEARQELQDDHDRGDPRPRGLRVGHRTPPHGPDAPRSSRGRVTVAETHGGAPPRTQSTKPKRFRTEEGEASSKETSLGTSTRRTIRLPERATGPCGGNPRQCYTDPSAGEDDPRL